MTATLVAAIVVGTNDGRWLDACFRSLTSSSYPNLRLIYVDNASTDGSPDKIEADFPTVEILRNETNTGFANANNRGMSHAFAQGAAYAVLINPDTRTPEGMIGELVAFLKDNPAYGVIGPMQSVYDCTNAEDPTANDWSRHALENGEKHVFHHWLPELPSEAGGDNGRAPGTLEHAYVQGAALAIRRDAAEQAGLFDPVYHTFYEEVDLCRRVRWAGYRVALLKRVRIAHAGGSESGEPPSKYRAFHMTRNRFLYLFTEPNIRPSDVVRLTLAWIKDDVTVQIRQKNGLVKSWTQYAQVWGSLAKLSCYVVRTRLRNGNLASARTNAD